MSEKIYPTIQESVDSLQDRINKVIGTQPQPVFDYYFCFTCQKKHHRQSICTAPLIAPMNRVTKEEFAEKYSGAQQAWCAYCNAFIEGNGWHLKSECPDGKIGALKMAEEIERRKKENSLSPEAFGILLERIEKLEKLGTDHNLRKVYEANSILMEDFDKRLRVLSETTNNLYEICADLQKRILTAENFIGQNYKEDIKSLTEDYKKLYIAKTELYLEHTKRHQENKERIQNIEYRLDRHYPNQEESEFAEVEEDTNRKFYLTEINKLNADRRNMNVLINHLSDRLEKIENTNPTQSTVDILMNGVENVGRRLDKTGELLADFIKSANGRMERLQKEDACLTTIIGKFREETWERVEGFEHELNTLQTDYADFKLGYPKLVENFIEMNVKNLHDRIDEICKNFDANRVIIEKKPHKCPVCLGNPLAELRITKTESGKDKLLLECHACEGKGVVWA